MIFKGRTLSYKIITYATKSYQLLVENCVNSTLAEIFYILKHSTAATYAFAILLFSACGNKEQKQSRGAIVLGDSTTIITEKDSQFLKDDVLDMEPIQPETPAPTQPTPDTKDTTTKGSTTSIPETEKPVLEKGFVVDFGEAKMVLAGLDANDARKQNAQKDAGLTYVLKSNDISVGNVVFHNVKNVIVKQRYQTKLILKSALGRLDLKELGLYTSDWKPLNGKNTAGKESFGLNALNNLSYASVNNNKIANAADRELRKRRTSSRNIQAWMKEIKKTRNAQDKPCEVILDNVQWQVSGTDAKGKPFQKTIRVDA